MRAFLPSPGRFLAGLLVAASILTGHAARADQILWYNGDFDDRDALTNQTGPADGLVYDNFVVPTGVTFIVSSVFSNNFLYDPGQVSTAHWELRSGVSAGDGGTLLFSGDDFVTLTATGRSLDTGGILVDEYTTQVDVNVSLTAGTYWLAVAPNVSNQNSYIATTSGANAVGFPPGDDGNSLFSSSFFGADFLPTSDDLVEGAGTWDYSMGVIGTAVPEPSSLLLGVVGLLTTAGYRWSRRRSLA